MRKIIAAIAASCGLVFCMTSAGWAVDFTWDGGGDGTSWTDPTNWDLDSGFPVTGDDAIFNGPGTVQLDGQIPNGFSELRVNGGTLNLNNIANMIPGGTVYADIGSTVRVSSSGGASGLGAASVLLRGATLSFFPETVALVDGFNETIFNEPTADVRTDIQTYIDRALATDLADGQGVLTGRLRWRSCVAGLHVSGLGRRALVAQRVGLMLRPHATGGDRPGH